MGKADKNEFARTLLNSLIICCKCPFFYSNILIYWLSSSVLLEIKKEYYGKSYINPNSGFAKN